MSTLYLLLFDHYDMTREKPKTSSGEFPAWLKKARSVALNDYGIDGISLKAYRDLFDAGWTPQQAALKLAERSSVK